MEVYLASHGASSLFRVPLDRLDELEALSLGKLACQVACFLIEAATIVEDAMSCHFTAF